MEMIIIFLILLFLNSVADIVEKVLDRLPRKRKKKEETESRNTELPSNVIS